MAKQAALDLVEFVDGQRLGKYQILVASLCAIAVFIDGFDAQVMGPVGPTLMAQLHVARTAFGSIISSGTFGMMLGALTFGPLADRFGRKPVLIACVFSFGIGSLVTASATSAAQLIVFRVGTGIGLGGVMPNAIAMTSEYMPARSRNTAVMVMFGGFSLGSAVAGWTVAALIHSHGWQSIFIVGGSLPVVFAIVLSYFLPGSTRFSAAAQATGTTVSTVTELFRQGRGFVTLMLWTMFLMNLLNLWFLNNWLPTIMNDAGITVEVASLITSLFQVGGLVGTLALAAFGQRVSFRVLAAVYFGTAIMITLIGNAGASVRMLIVTVFASGMGVIGGQIAANALTAGYYPTSIRSTGVGWALGIGRVGSIVGPLVGGVLLSYGGSARSVFWAAAAPALVAMFAAAAVNARYKEPST